MENQTNTTQTPGEIMLLIVPSVYEIFMSVFIASLIFSKMEEKYLLKTAPTIQFLLDFSFIVIPTILDLTILSNTREYAINLILMMCIYFGYVLFVKQRYESDPKEVIKTNKRPFITNMRSTITLITVVAILAVDFKVFPFRFTKNDKYGFSLMDVGVGLFVCSNGIVAPELHRPVHNIYTSVKSSVPLMLLGGLRFILTRSVDYNVSVTEYGTHWNFFITLAVTKILCSIILNASDIKYSLYISVFVLGLHENFLQSGMADWVLSNAPRTNFISANREGIVSSLGYVGLYFFSVSLGKILNRRFNRTISDLNLGILLTMISIVLISLTLLFDKYLGVSRRLANTGYCLWILFIMTFMALLFLILENVLTHLYKYSGIRKKIYTPILFEAINFNGLSFFLIANVLTGVVNISCKTSEISLIPTLLILFGYMLVNCVFVTVLYQYNVKLTRFLTG